MLRGLSHTALAAYSSPQSDNAEVSTKTGQEEALIQFYDVEKCGFYPKRKPDVVDGQFPKVTQDIYNWLTQKKPRVAETATYSADPNRNLLPAYCVASYAEAHEFLFTLWVETEVTEDNNFASISKRSTANSARISRKPLGEDDIPGVPAYFWMLPSRNLIGSIRFRRQHAHISKLRRYMKGYLETHYSGLKTASVHNTRAVDGLDGYTLSDLDSRVEFKPVHQDTDAQKIIANYAQIRKIIVRKNIHLPDEGDKRIFDSLREAIGLGKSRYSENIDRDMHYKGEIAYKPTRDEVRQIIDNFEAVDGWEDIGFSMSDMDSEKYVTWLNRSFSKEKTELRVSRTTHDGLVVLESLMRTLQERKSALLKNAGITGEKTTGRKKAKKAAGT